MATRRQFVPYRRNLKPCAQSLRRDPSPAERKLWFEFLRDLPFKFTRQKPLGYYIADFYCASRQLVIEVDGDSHYTDSGQRYDATRNVRLELEGIRVMRVTNREVMHEFEGVCQRILDVLTRLP